MPTNDKKLNQDSSYFLTEFYCKLTIKGVEFLPQNILNISIKESIFNLFPVLELSILDDAELFERHPLEDADLIQIQLGSSNLKKPIINMEFQLHDHEVISMDGDNVVLNQINLTGIIRNTNLLFPQSSRSFPNKSSFDVLKTIASECGFNPMVKTSTTDAMVWRQLNQSNFQMICETMKRAYKPQDVILTGITRNRDFIITSLMTELKNKSVKKAVYDPLQAISVSNEKSTEKKETIYFNNYSMTNIAGTVNKSIGYGVSYSVYDFDKVVNKKIDSSFHPLTKFSYKDKTNVGKTSQNDGLYFLNNKTMHKNYVDALIQNEFYSRDFFKQALIINVNPNEKINMFDKFNLTFPSFESGSGINLPQSGEYIVGSLVHHASKEGYYYMKLALFRNGLNGSAFQKDQEFRMAK